MFFNKENEYTSTCGTSPVIHRRWRPPASRKRNEYTSTCGTSPVFQRRWDPPASIIQRVQGVRATTLRTFAQYVLAAEPTHVWEVQRGHHALRVLCHFASNGHTNSPTPCGAPVGRASRSVSSVCRSRRSVVGRSAGRSGRSIGSVGRRLVGRAAGRLLGRSANRTGRSVHPIGPSIRPIGRLGGGSVGGTGRTLKQA